MLLEARKTSARLQEQYGIARTATADAEKERANLKLIFEKSRVGMALVREPDFVFERVNDAFKSLVSPREFLKQRWSDVFKDARDGQALSALHQVYATGERCLHKEVGVRIKTPEGEQDRFVNYSYDRIEGINAFDHGVLIQVIDVTEEINSRKKARADEVLAREARTRLFGTLTSIPTGVAILEGPRHVYSFVNHEHNAFFGGRSDFIGKAFAEALPELATSNIPILLDRVYGTGEPFHAEEFEIPVPQVDHSTKTIVYRLGFQPLRDVEGEVTGIVVTATDITDLVAARREVSVKNGLLAETQRLLTLATKVAKVGFFEWRIPENLIFFSDQMQRDWGSSAGVPLESVLEQILPDQRPVIAKLIEEAVIEKTPYRAEYQIQRLDDRKVTWIEAQGEVTYSDEGEPLTFFGTSIDITSRKNAELEIRAVANSIPLLAWTADASGQRTWFNDRWYDYTGTTFETARGQGWRSVHHPDHVERVVAQYAECWRLGRDWEDLYPLRRADGEYRWFLSRAAPIRGDDGRILRWFGSNTDVTDQKEAEASLTRLAAVVETSRDFIGMCDLDFRPIFLNHGGRDMTDFGDRNLRETAIADFFPPDQLPKVEGEVIPALLRDGFWEGELMFRNFETGASIPVLYNLFAVPGKGGDAAIAYATVTRDISDRKKFEASLEESTEGAEKANSAKSVFLANMSHEIRSPLGAIMGFADLMKGADVSRDDLANYIAIIDRNSRHVLRIVDDILDLSKVEAGKMLIEQIEFSLKDMLADFISLMGLKARDRGIDLELNIPHAIPEHIISDPTRMRQILTNVVGNAVKFTERGRVTVTVRFHDHTLEFEVVDTGVGLTTAQADTLFQAFQQADVSTTRRYGGTGLGLLLTRRIAEAMGGAFDLKSSEVGVGSTFVASLMILVPNGARTTQVPAREPLIASGAPECGHRPLASMQILVIEDSPDNQVLFKIMLNSLGAAVEIAHDGVEGVQMALNKKFDLVLCDVQMPRMDGYEVVAELSARAYPVPIVALTAHAMKEERDRAITAGFSDFLSKPVRRDALLATLMRHRPRDVSQPKPQPRPPDLH